MKSKLYLLGFALLAAWGCKQQGGEQSGASASTATGGSTAAGTTSAPAPRDLKGCTEGTWENGGDISTMQFCEEQVLYFQGKVGDVAMRGELGIDNFADGDSLLVRGAYYYDGKTKTIELSGYWNKQAGTLRLGDLQAKETFYMKFDGSTASGTWQKNGKQLPCSLAAVDRKGDVGENYDFLGAVASIMQANKESTFAIDGTAGQRRLRIVKDASLDSEYITCYDFNQRRVKLSYAEVGESHTDEVYQLLRFSKVPSILYVKAASWNVKVPVYEDPNGGGLVTEDEVPEGEEWESAGSATSSEVDMRCVVYRLSGGKWVAEEQSIPTESLGDEPIIGDGSITTMQGTWEWDGERLAAPPKRPK